MFFTDTYNCITAALRAVTMVILLHAKALVRSTWVDGGREVTLNTAFSELKIM